MTGILRQGDVLLVPCREPATLGNKTPRDARGRIVLSYGEATGHAHAVLERDAVLWDNGKGVRILHAPNPAELVHESHDKITLPAGFYNVLQQTEWTDADEPRAVAD